MECARSEAQCGGSSALHDEMRKRTRTAAPNSKKSSVLQHAQQQCVHNGDVCHWYVRCAVDACAVCVGQRGRMRYDAVDAVDASGRRYKPIEAAAPAF